MTDTIVPKDKWQFDEEVTLVFDDMLRRSIPQYDVMREAVFRVGQHFRQDNTAIVDLGCSRGDALAPFVYAYDDHNRYIGVDVSEPMLAAAKRRFAQHISWGWVDIRYCDLRREDPPETASLTLSVLTLQFTPIEYRQQIVRQCYEHTVPKGAFILVEKVLGATATIDECMVDIYYDLKRRNGYTQEQIDRKRYSLEGVLVPITARWNEELLHNAGFREVDCFWRWMNFAAWVAVK